MQVGKMRAGFFHQGGNKAYMPKKVPNTQRIINTVILKIVNIVFSGWGQLPPPTPAVYGPDLCNYVNKRTINYLSSTRRRVKIQVLFSRNYNTKTAYWRSRTRLRK